MTMVFIAQYYLQAVQQLGGWLNTSLLQVISPSHGNEPLSHACRGSQKFSDVIQGRETALWPLLSHFYVDMG